SLNNMPEKGWGQEPIPERAEVLEAASIILKEFALNFAEVEGKKLVVNIGEADREALVAVEGEKKFYVRDLAFATLDEEFDFFLEDLESHLKLLPGNVLIEIS